MFRHFGLSLARWARNSLFGSLWGRSEIYPAIPPFNRFSINGVATMLSKLRPCMSVHSILPFLSFSILFCRGATS